MSSKQDRKDFFENPFSNEYIRYCNGIIRQSVMIITSACSYSGKDKKNPLDEQAVNIILSSCKELIRASEVSELLASNDDDLYYVNIDLFTDNFVKSAAKSIGQEIAVEMTESGSFYANTNVSRLTYLILTFLRKAVMINENIEKVVLSPYRNDDGDATLAVKLISSGVRGVSDGSLELIGLSYDELCELFASKINAEISYDESSLTITFKDASSHVDPTLMCSSLGMNGDIFSAYEVMLSDLF